jgi:hypothetical protein
MKPGSGIVEYWIVNLMDRCVEAYREPSTMGYCSMKRYMPGGIIVPLKAPEAGIPVANLLP